MRVTVIGAGILGSALGYRLARAGTETTIVDADRDPAGASWASFAWLNANGKEPRSYFELNRAGITALSALSDELSDEGWFHPVGSIELAPRGPAADELRGRAQRQAALSYRSKGLDPAALAILEPSLSVDPERDEAVLFEDEGWLDTARLIELLRLAAVENGARLCLGNAVRGVERGAVETADGDRWTADVIVNVGGASGGDVSAMAGGCLPSTSGTFGLTAVTAPVESVPARVIRWPGGTARPHPGGGVMVASTGAVDKQLAESRDAAADAALAAEAVALAAAYLPALTDASVTSVRVARRAVPADSMPICGFDAQVPWLYHLVSHSGVTLSALLSQLVADEIVRGRVDPRIEAYRPARFAD